MERALEQTSKGGLEAMAQQLSGALASPGTFGTAPPHVPVVVPPDIRRVWVPTHQSFEGELVSGHWVYLRLTDFRWFLEAGPVSERWPAGVLPEGASAPRGVGIERGRHECRAVGGGRARRTPIRRGRDGDERGAPEHAPGPGELAAGWWRAPMTRPAWTHEDIEALHSDVPSLGELLPWRWVEAGALHVLADGSAGLAWRLPLLDAELRSALEREPMARAFDGLLTRLPAGVAFQVIAVSSPCREDRLTAWARRNGGQAPLLQALADARVGALTTPRAGEPAARDLRVLLTLRYWPPGVRASSWRARVARWMGTRAVARRVASEWAQAEAVLQSCRMLVETQCAVAGVEPTRLDGAGLLDEIWPLLNPGCPEGPPPYRDDWALHTQAAQTDYAFRPGGWSVSGLSPALEGRILSVLTLPAETWPGLMTLPRTVGGSGGVARAPRA